MNYILPIRFIWNPLKGWKEYQKPMEIDLLYMQAESGACIQCCNRSCFQAYHVTCAKRAGLYMSMTQGIKGAISNKLTLKSYCERHSPAEFDETKVLDGIRRTRLYYRDTKLLNEENARLSKDRETANKLNIFKWNTEANTPIALNYLVTF